jgi:formamidopyrimidine-DNA glycosylase
MWTLFLRIRASEKWAGRSIVELLMDPHTLVSGIGNYLSVEILLEAGIDPRSPVDCIDRGWFTLLYDAMCRKTAESYYNNTTEYLKHLGVIVPQRTPLAESRTDRQFTFRVYRQRHVDGKYPVVPLQDVITNRGSGKTTTYMCPSLQRLLTRGDRRDI